MKIRKLLPQELTIVSQWFFDKCGVAPESWLLSNYGFIAETKEMQIAAMFLFPTIGSELAFIGWPMSNPLSDKEERSVALDALILKIEEHARNLGYKYLTTFSSRPQVAKRFAKHGYMLGDSQVDQYVKAIDGENLGRR